MNKEISGFLLVNKPKNITSFDCIRHIKKIYKGTQLKIGHAGTLDPFASGLLIIALGRNATKHIVHCMQLDKEYIALGKLGELTTTLDKTGSLIQSDDIEPISTQSIITALHTFGSEYVQTPPLFAALKYQGKPLYAHAREGKLALETLQEIANQKQRPVKLFEVQLLDMNNPFFTLKAHVSHGTYIRSLVNDIGQKLGTYATTYELERTKIGPFRIEQAQNLENLKSNLDIEKHLIPVPSVIERLKEYIPTITKNKKYS